MNWKDNVMVYGQLHEISNSLAAGYSILAYSFPNHSSVEEWNIKAAVWNEYWHNLSNLVLTSAEGAECEIARLNKNSAELRGVQKQTYFLQ